MHKARIVINKDYKLGTIDDRIYGSFVEHMGRVVYSGIYEPGHPEADEDGFRKDVLAAVKEAGITNIRYPGGNFVSCYHWEDGIGKKEERPRRLELAWRAIETNEFGTDEFMKWCEKAGTEPLLAVNLGTKGLEDAVHYLEYCNFPGGTSYSDRRIENGRVEPYNVRMWCLGNEMDGHWQLGHKSASEYGRLARETAKAMKLIDPDIELVSCGSSLNTMATFPQWEEESLEETYEYVDYISLHQYFDGHEKTTEEFLAQADAMDEYIKIVIAACDFIKAKKRSDKTLNISFDEWGVWTRHSDETVRECDISPWQQAQPISEMIYSFKDALLFGGMLLAILKNADRVKVACQSLLTNISAMIMTEKGGEMWKQTIYYPFADVAQLGHGEVLDSRVICPEYATKDKKSHVPLIDTVTVKNGNEIVLFAINRSSEISMEIEMELQGFEVEEVIEHRVLCAQDIEADNSVMHNLVKTSTREDVSLEEEKAACVLDKITWNAIRFRIKE